MVECVVCGPFKWAGLRRGLTLIKYLTGQLKNEQGLFGLMVSGNISVWQGWRGIMALSVDGGSLQLVHIVADQEGD